MANKAKTISDRIRADLLAEKLTDKLKQVDIGLGEETASESDGKIRNIIIYFIDKSYQKRSEFFNTQISLLPDTSHVRGLREKALWLLLTLLFEDITEGTTLSEKSFKFHLNKTFSMFGNQLSLMDLDTVMALFKEAQKFNQTPCDAESAKARARTIRIRYTRLLDDESRREMRELHEFALNPEGISISRKGRDILAQFKRAEGKRSIIETLQILEYLLLAKRNSGNKRTQKRAAREEQKSEVYDFLLNETCIWRSATLETISANVRPGDSPSTGSRQSIQSFLEELVRRDGSRIERSSAENGEAAYHFESFLPQAFVDRFVTSMFALGPAESETAALDVLWSFFKQTEALEGLASKRSKAHQSRTAGMVQSLNTLEDLCTFLLKRHGLDGTYLCEFDYTDDLGETNHVSGYPLQIRPAYGGKDICLITCPSSTSEYTIGWDNGCLNPFYFDTEQFSIRGIHNLSFFQAENEEEKKERQSKYRKEEKNGNAPVFSIEDFLLSLTSSNARQAKGTTAVAARLQDEAIWGYDRRLNDFDLNKWNGYICLKAQSEYADKLINTCLASQIEQVFQDDTYMVNLVESPGFFGLIAVSRGEIEIIWPKEVRNDFENYLSSILSSYKDNDTQSLGEAQKLLDADDIDIDWFIPF